MRLLLLLFSLPLYYIINFIVSSSFNLLLVAQYKSPYYLQQRRQDVASARNGQNGTLSINTIHILLQIIFGYLCINMHCLIHIMWKSDKMNKFVCYFFLLRRSFWRCEILDFSSVSRHSLNSIAAETQCYRHATRADWGLRTLNGDFQSVKWSTV